MQIKCGTPSKVTHRMSGVQSKDVRSAKKPRNSPHQHNLNKPRTGTIARIKRIKHLFKRFRTDSYKSRQYTDGQYTQVPLDFLKGNTTMCNMRDTLNGVNSSLGW